MPKLKEPKFNKLLITFTDDEMEELMDYSKQTGLNAQYFIRHCIEFYKQNNTFIQKPTMISNDLNIPLDIKELKTIKDYYVDKYPLADFYIQFNINEPFVCVLHVYSTPEQTQRIGLFTLKLDENNSLVNEFREYGYEHIMKKAVEKYS